MRPVALREGFLQGHESVLKHLDMRVCSNIWRTSHRCPVVLKAFCHTSSEYRFDNGGYNKVIQIPSLVRSVNLVHEELIKPSKIVSHSL